MLNNYKTVFQKFKISKQDEALYLHLAKSATSMEELDKVINHFMEKYVSRANRDMYSLILDTLNISLSRQLTVSESADMQRVFSLTSRAYEDKLKTNFAIISNMIIPSAVDLIGGDKYIRDQLVKDLISSFDDRIIGAMSQTRADVLDHVRKLQRELIVRNQQYINMKNNGVLDSVIEKEKAKFKSDMLKKYPRLEKMLNEGQILRSRSWKDKDGIERFKSYTLDDYTEMSVSETLKNIDRDAVEMVAKYQGDPFVEFYLSDARHVEEPNYACDYIMQNCKYEGIVLLATNEYYAKLFKIWSIDKAKAEHSLEISRHCRHSIRRAPDHIINKLNKLIAIQKLTDQDV